MNSQEAIELLQKARNPSEIFPNRDPDKDYKTLAKLVHPDITGNTNSMDKLNRFRTIAKLQITHNIWGCASLETPSYVDDAGPCYKQGTCVYLPNSDLVTNSNKVLETLRSKSDNFSKYIATPGQECSVLIKDSPSKVISNTLRDRAFLLGGPVMTRKFPDGLPGHHIAWLFSRFLEFVAFCHQQGISHNGLTPKSVWVCPETHGIQVISAYHSTPLNNKLVTISAEYKNWYPSTIFGNKKATSQIDLEMIQQMALFLLKKQKTEPNFIKFLNTPHTKALETYTEYREELRKWFGPPKYYKLEI